MSSPLHGHPTVSPTSFLGVSAFQFLQPPTRSAAVSFLRGTAIAQILYKKGTSLYLQNRLNNSRSKKLISVAPRCSRSSNSNESKDQSKFAGVDPLQAGNVVQLVLVLGLTVGWISTYIFRVSNKEMTYAQQLRDYEDKVMQKRLEGLTEAELEALLEQVDEEKRSQASGEQVN
ncbi:MAR-binding filament-like protein 1-1 isoform 2 [Theobroma cacao]|uniref:MAR-binding filament-like protein 1-1 isoform 2 n=1 Tax=Theobroma cacao TaxID=3641 RepID=A0A061FWX6_THECC|nr:MAR-binding filament-like protein 1-1 isoform 2 [Theobroma cacao]